MGSRLTTNQELKIENSRQLSNVALVLLPAIGVFVGIILQFRIVDDLFWWLSGGAAIASAVSIYLGGLGISQLRRDKPPCFSSFNLQAVFVVVSFLLLIFAYFVNGEEKTNDLQKRIDVITQDIGTLTERLRAFEMKTSSFEGKITMDLGNINRNLSQSKENSDANLATINNQLNDIKSEIEQLKKLVTREDGEGRHKKSPNK